MKLKKMIIPSVLILLLILGAVYVVFFTNIIFNHSCIGITYASNESALGTDIIIRYFDYDKDAKRLYKAENIDTYYIAAVDADNSKGFRNTEEWFSSLEAPLVYENEKFVQTTSLGEFAEQHELMLYEKGKGLDDGIIDKDELDKTVQLYHIGTEWMTVNENCTEAEEDYLFRHCAFAFSLESDFDRYRISVEQEDEFSKNFWRYQLIDVCKKWDLPIAPTTNRPNIEWDVLDYEHSSYIEVLKDKVSLLESSKTLTEEDWEEINGKTLFYTASIVNLSRKLNSDDITPIKTETLEAFTSESVVVSGTIAKTGQTFPTFCLQLSNEYKITLKEIDSSQEYNCTCLYFYDDPQVNGGYDYNSLLDKKVTVTAQLEDYRGAGELYLCNPIIREP